MPTAHEQVRRVVLRLMEEGHGLTTYSAESLLKVAENRMHSPGDRVQAVRALAKVRELRPSSGEQLLKLLHGSGEEVGMAVLAALPELSAHFPRSC